MYKKEKLDNKIIYKDKNNKEIEVLLNKDPILDVDNKYNLDFFLKNKAFLEFIIQDIQSNFNRMYYITKEYNILFEELITSYNFKIMTYQVNISNNTMNKENRLSKIKNKVLWENYMLENINKIFRQNSKYLENKTYNEYTKEHLEFIIKHDNCEVLYKNNSIIGSVCYNVDTGSDYIYIRDVYGNSKVIIEEILEMLLSKYKMNIKIDVTFMNKDLLEVIRKLNGEIKSVIYAWKRRG